jgi:hypothetical protein
MEWNIKLELQRKIANVTELKSADDTKQNVFYFQDIFSL